MYSFLVLISAVLALTGESYAAPATGLSISKTTRCGSSFQLTCKGSKFGDCCSAYGYCGSTSDYCGKGCQSGFGKCSLSYTTKPSPATISPGAPSKDGSCGGSKGRTCLGSTFGNCCRLVPQLAHAQVRWLTRGFSRYGFCGSSSAYCGLGCQSRYGKCSSSPSSTIKNKPTTSCSQTSSKTQSKSTTSCSRSNTTRTTKPSSSTPAAYPSSTLKVTTNARCGAGFGFTCMGSQWGDCCSKNSNW